MSQNEHSHHDVYHITPFSTYVKVFSVLILMTIITVYSAKYMHFGVLNTPIAMAIASFKAFCVVWWFMHQKYENALNRTIFVSGFIFLAIFVFFTAVDIWTRVSFWDLNFK